MPAPCIDPIQQEWPSLQGGGPRTLSEVVALVSAFAAADIPDRLIPYLSAATTEAALIAGVPWRFSSDTATVALLRMLSRASFANPGATGPHLQCFYEQLAESR